jgi:hypothetical protein
VVRKGIWRGRSSASRRGSEAGATGSANESRWALLVALAWGYVSAAQARPAAELLDRVVAMLWRLTRGP